MIQTQPKAGDARYCGHCAWGDHRLCSGALRGPCGCATQDHQPDERTRSAMRLYQRPDLAGDTTENLAREWSTR
jgi:hypothetical protein